MDRPPSESERARAAAEIVATRGAALRRAARRVSICEADAEDAFQRAVEILLRKAPTTDGRRLYAWMTVVTRREALAVRRARERHLSALPSTLEDEPVEPLDLLPSTRPGPAESVLRSERVAEARAALERLKAAERLALVLKAQGYSYAEICALCDWTYTKVNRSLAEGRARLREFGAKA